MSEEREREIGMATQRGADVRIRTPGIPDKKLVYKVTRSNYGQLARKGGRIYEYTPGFMPSKQFLCDNEIAIVGTINMDYRSLYHHFENGVIFAGFTAVNDVRKDFDETFPKCMEVTEQYVDQKVWLRLGHSMLRLLAPLL